MHMRGAERERVDGRRCTERSRSIAQSPILTTTITLERLAKRGYESLLDYYLKVRPEQTFMGLSFTS